MKLFSAAQNHALDCFLLECGRWGRVNKINILVDHILSRFNLKYDKYKILKR